MFANQQRIPTLGIMVGGSDHPIPSALRSHLRRLSIAGNRLGLSILIFRPDHIDWMSRQVRGVQYDRHQEAWREVRQSLPPLIYDRCFLDNSEKSQPIRKDAKRLKTDPLVRFLNTGLGNKWQVYCLLRKYPSIAPYLPPTKLLRQTGAWEEAITRSRNLFLKPVNGSQGKGTMRVQRSSQNQFVVHGRDERNHPFQMTFEAPHEWVAWLKRRIGQRPYLAQTYLDLTASDGVVFDVRSLMQKDGKGVWRLTGLAVRTGQPGSITSNLHGGGKVEEITPFLQREYGHERASTILEALQRLSTQIAPLLETYWGRLAEIGIDFGIDRKGNIWILEVNSKPGRTAFYHLSDPKQRLNAIIRPIAYARYLLQSNPITLFDVSSVHRQSSWEGNR